MGNETFEVLCFKTIDGLEKELDLLIKDVEEEHACLAKKASLTR